jgi:protein-arginine deiminase
MASDPLAGLEILQQAQQAGHGKERAVSRPRSLKDSDKRYIATTIDEVLNSLEFAAVQNSSAAYITRNIDILKHETGLTDADIIRQPCLYQLEYGPPEENYVPNVWNYTATAGNDTRQIVRRTGSIRALNLLDAGTSPGKLGKRPAHRNGARSLERRQGFNSPELDEEWPVHSLYPATINSVVVDRKHIIAPNPWGPVIDGRDVLVAATDEAYATAGYTVRYIDEWFTHHTDLGDVHCGTNVIRHLPADKWW